MYLYTDVSLYYYHGFMRRPVATGEYQEGGQQQQNKNNIKKTNKTNKNKNEKKEFLIGWRMSSSWFVPMIELGYTWPLGKTTAIGKITAMTKTTEITKTTIKTTKEQRTH